MYISVNDPTNYDIYPYYYGYSDESFELIFFTYHKYVLTISWTLEFYPFNAYQSDNGHNIHNDRSYVS